MDKEQFTTILQACLFCFDGATEQEIMKLNPNYNLKFVRAGCNLCSYLKSMELTK